MEKVHFSTCLSFFQTSGSSELYKDNEIFVKHFNFFLINQKTFSTICKEIVKVHVNMDHPVLYGLNCCSCSLVISDLGEIMNT